MLSGACFSMFFHAKGIDLGLQQACSCGSIACARAGWAMSPVARMHCFSPSRPSPAHPRVAVFFLAAYRFFPVLAVFMACLRDEKCEKKRTLLRFATMRRPTCPALFHAAGRRGRGCAALRRIRLERSSSAWRVAPSPPLAFSGVLGRAADAAFHYLSVWGLSTRCGMSPCPTRSMGQPKCSSSSSMGSSVSG